MNKPAKSLTKGFKRDFGRNNRGLITCRHRGGGHKRLYRTLDFRREKRNIQAVVTTIEYDPNRTADIALIEYADGEKRYILHPAGLEIGDTVLSSTTAPNKVGNSLLLMNTPLGCAVHNVELTPGKGGQLVRAAGAGAQIVAKEGNFVTLRLPSGEVRLVREECWATIGQVGNRDAMNRKFGKAGRMRWLGKRPTVRGVVMNPCDHPHGGGEGRSPIGRPRPVTPWGRPALGQKTRKKNKFSNQYIVRRRNSR